MSTALVGPRISRPGDDSTRIHILVDEDVVHELRVLLHLPFMTGVGWSEFIERAVKRALEEADEQGLLDQDPGHA